MGIKSYNPYTPSRRHMTGSDFSEITKSTPEKSLTVSLKKNAGRNNQGKITVRHRGGGSRRKYRIIDFKRRKDGIPATVVSIEYDPNRTANIALISYVDGEKAYILAPEGLKVGQKVMNGADAEVRVGNCLPLELIPVGTMVHNIELHPGKGGQMVRSAGNGAQLMAKEGKYATLRLPSGEMRMVPIVCRASVGVVGNGDHNLINIGKAGRKRMGYHVAIMADSTSRWAEALRELSGRLEEMPAEEGFPAYLASRLSAFYERAGMMQNLNGTEGSVTIIGAVSPQGGDFSEPVTMNTKRFVRCFWGLDKSLAYARHFPAIHWLTSYSEYINDLSSWYMDNVDKRFVDDRNRLMALLVQESSLMEIVKLIGADVLPDDQKLVLEIAKVIRLGFLQQNAFHKDDTSVPLIKQFKMMEVILYLYKKSRSLVSMGMPVSVLKEENIFDKIISIKYDVPNDRLEMFDDYMKMIDGFYDRVVERNA